MDISFISVNFRSAQALECLLLSLENHFRGNSLQIEYIVVNNDINEKKRVDTLKEKFSRLEVIHSLENIGFGRANQMGSEGATGKHLFFINPDTTFRSGNFHGLIEAFEFRPSAIFGMALECTTGKRERWSSGSFPSLWQLLRNNCSVLPRSAPWETGALQPVDWVSGAALAIRKDFFQELGGFQPDFFLYFEDVDLARRAQEKGAWIAVYPFIRFIHAGGGSIESVSSQKSYFYRSQRRYFEKWRPKYEFLIVSGLQWLFRCR